MKVYKFGGASVQSAEGVKNMAGLVSREPGVQIVVVSAMGKTTNALEQVVKACCGADTVAALNLLEQNRLQHAAIIDELFATDPQKAAEVNACVGALYTHTADFITHIHPADHDFVYDQIVALGELVSTRIVSEYLAFEGLSVSWLDIRRVLETDSTFGEANINLEAAEQNLHKALQQHQGKIIITQGFIGGNEAGHTTTLGREGSDYTAAVLAALAGAHSVTIWKDVPGVLNADPRVFEDTQLLPTISYKEAAELSYYGAQIIHPKTIKPLQNKKIPLHVKSFIDPLAQGTVIEGDTVQEKTVPVFILKHHQILITIRPKDFSFALEETLPQVFNILLKHRLKVNLIQSSAVSISVCVDNSRSQQAAIDELMTDYRVVYNNNLDLLTIRNYTPQLIEHHTQGRQVYLMQKTRRTLRMLMDGKV